MSLLLCHVNVLFLIAPYYHRGPASMQWVYILKFYLKMLYLMANWVIQHPPMHHPKNLVYRFFGWDETQPKPQDKVLLGVKLWFFSHAPNPNNFIIFLFPTPLKPPSYLPLTSLLFSSLLFPLFHSSFSLTFLYSSTFHFTIFSCSCFLPLSICIVFTFFVFCVFFFCVWFSYVCEGGGAL
jgi:hypothetical protein